MRVLQDKRSTTVAAMVTTIVLLGMTNMSFYTNRLLPGLSPLFASTSIMEKDGTSIQNDKNLDSVYPLLNDKTLSPPLEQAPAQMLLTNYGWNHPSEAKGLMFARSIRSSQLLRGVLKHPWFRSVSWDEVSSQPTNMTTYVFLDVEMCFELNWPHFAGKDKENVDVANNRSTEYNRGGDCCQFQKQALAQPIFESPNTRLVLFDCSGDGMRYCCLPERNTNKTTVVSISAKASQQTGYDLGLPPPAGKPIHLTQQQIQDIETCNEASRSLLYTFAGSFNRGNVRQKLKAIHNGNDVLVVNDTLRVNMTYDEFLLSSKFAGTPKGDNLFSYRFTEAMSAGAIPVVHADDWVLPFSNKLINWSKCAVVIPEARVRETVIILSNITAEERCEMRKCVLETYRRFMSSPEGTIDGLVKSLEISKNLGGHLDSPLNGKTISPKASVHGILEQSKDHEEKSDSLPSHQNEMLDSPLNDKTIPWPRRGRASSHPAQILLTNYGWNHPNQVKGLTFARSIRSTKLVEGVLKHPWFRPVSWDEVSSQPTNITTYVFLDVEMCFELNWPHYGINGNGNVEVSGNRSTSFERGGACCQFQDEALAQPIFQSPNTRLVLFDCSGHGLNYCCLNDRNVNKTSVVSISAKASQQSQHDLGLPPPAGKPINLTQKAIHDIETCNETSRPLLYTFAGSWTRGDLRPKLKPLHNGKNVLVVGNTRDVNLTYDELLLKSKFSGTPKGDNLFSYRFTEAMSAGSIPVVHADDWVLPFSNKLINWQKCAVVIPEARVNETISILSSITAEERCEMRNCVLQTYQRFMSSPEGTIDGIIKSLELENKKRRRRRLRRLLNG